MKQLKKIYLEAFNDIYKIKNKWIDMSPEDLQKHPELADEIFFLLSTAYKNIGGHSKFKSPIDLFRGDLSINAIDLDSDPEADATRITKQTVHGTKSLGMGHDGQRSAKDAAVDAGAKLLKQQGVYAEMGGAIAHILLTKHNVNSIDDEETVRKILQGKDIKWIGLHPEDKYPNNPGWYYRIIGPNKKLKIMLGLPLA